jgi:hypothetical protein
MNFRVAGLGVASVWMNMGLGSCMLDRLADASAQETALKRQERAMWRPRIEAGVMNRARMAHANPCKKNAH